MTRVIPSTSRTHDRASRPWVGHVGFAWALSYLPIHVYWALSGVSPAIGVVSGTREFRIANWGASLVILGAGLTCLALTQRWGVILPRSLRHGAAWVGAVFGIGHALAFAVPALLRLAGVLAYPTGTRLTLSQLHAYDWANVLYFEPWFAVMGVLLVACSRRARRHDRAADGEAASPGWLRRATWAPPTALAAVGLVAAAHLAWALGFDVLLPATGDTTMPRLVELGRLGAFRPASGVVAVLLVALALVMARRVDRAWRPAGTALTLAGIFAIVWGVFTFDTWTFAAYGPALLASGMLALLARAVARAGETDT